MKNNLLLIACISTISIHGMEIISSSKDKTENTFSIISHGTTIDLFKSSWDMHTGKIDINVFGANQKKREEAEIKLREGGRPIVTVIDVPHPVGTVVDIYKDDKGQTLALSVEEPCLNVSNKTNKTNKTNKQKKFFEYTVIREQIDLESGFREYFDNNDAIKEASNDLTLCYKNVLDTGLLKIANDHKSIAFPILGASFPKKQTAKIAVETILQFIKEFPGSYNHIKLFVNTWSEFELYKKLLQQKTEAQ